MLLSCCTLLHLAALLAGMSNLSDHLHYTLLGLAERYCWMVLEFWHVPLASLHAAESAAKASVATTQEGSCAVLKMRA